MVLWLNLGFLHDGIWAPRTADNDMICRGLLDGFACKVLAHENFV